VAIVPTQITPTDHPKLHALLQDSRATYFKIRVTGEQLLATTSCGSVRMDWVDRCRRPWGQHKFSVYRYDGTLVASNEKD